MHPGGLAMDRATTEVRGFFAARGMTRLPLQDTDGECAIGER